MRLKEYEQCWADILIHHDKNAAEKLAIGPEISSLYHQFVWRRLRSILQKMFERLGEVENLDWDSLAREYFLEYGSQNTEINEATYQFPQFLKNKGHCLHPWATELAEYEVLEFQSFKCLRRAFRSVQGVCHLNPCLEIQEFHYEIAHWVKQWEETGERPSGSPAQRSHVLAVTRHPSEHDNIFTEIGPVEIIICQLLEECDLSFRDLAIRCREELKGEISWEEIQGRIQQLRRQYLIV